MKSLTFSEQLADKYRLTCKGHGKNTAFPVIYSSLATCRAITREQGKRLSAAVTILGSSGIFGPNAWSLGDYVAEKIMPGPANWGWKRYPGADHWLVTCKGREIFRTQNYSFLLRYFARKAGVA